MFRGRTAKAARTLDLRLKTDTYAIYSGVTTRFTIRQLAQASGASVASIKFYLREQLLPPGERAAPARAYYSLEHLERLRLIRVLRELPKLPIEQIRAVLRALDAGTNPLDVVALAMDGLGRTLDEPSTREHSRARRELRQLLLRLGVTPRPEAGALRDLAAALVSLRRAWKPDLAASALLPYARLAQQLARLEVTAHAAALGGDGRQLLPLVMQGTLLFEPVLLAFRRLMHEDQARKLAARTATKPRAAGPRNKRVTRSSKRSR